MLRAKPAADEESICQPALSSLGALRTGFLTNVLNPKTTIFIVSLFMQVVQPQTPLAVQIGYGAFIALAHALWFGAVALFFSTLRCGTDCWRYATGSIGCSGACWWDSACCWH